MTNKKPIKTPEQVIRNIYKNISSTDKTAFLCGFIICLAVNLFVYTNTCFVHDSIQVYNDFDGTSNGRFLIAPLLMLLNRMQLPWLIGLITSVNIGFVVVYLAKIFKIEKKLNIAILAGLVVTSDCIVVTHMYFSYVYIYTFSLLLAVLAVYYTNKRNGFIYAIILLFLCMIIYQAYIATATGLYIFMLIIDLYENDKPIKDRIKLIAKYASIIIISILIYYVIWMLVLKLTNTSINGYGYYNKMGEIPGISDLLSRIGYTFAISIINITGIIGENFYFLTFVNLLIVAIALILLIVNAKKRSGLIFILIYLAAYLFSINMLYIISDVPLHTLAVFSVVLLPLSLLYLCERVSISKLPELKKYLSWVVSVLCVVLIIGQAVFANSLYLKVKVNYDNSWSYATRVIDRIEQTEGFNSDTKVVLINYNNVTKPYKQNEEINKAVGYPLKFGLAGKWIDSPSGITYAETLKWFITQEMDMDINISYNDDELFESDEVKNMGYFPAEDSVKMIGDTLVVKMY